MGVAALGIGPPSEDVIREVCSRAANDYERWSEQVAHANYCSRPIRLVGRVEQVHRQTGEVRETFSTDNEPDNSLLIACGSRREARCPSCARTYRGDAYQIVASGLKGGKGVPESVIGHPMLFVTFTAPSFGPVHAHRSSGGAVPPCRPRRSGKCPHGIPLSCWRRHQPEDDCVGQPLCTRCFDYDALVLWNALASELWRRTTTYIKREMAAVVGMKQKELEKTARLSYVKVGEYQRRGAVHFHAVLRLDGYCKDEAHVFAPPEQFTEEVLEKAVRGATSKVFAPLPGCGPDARVVARWGSQLDVRPIMEAGTAFTPESVAAYVAKYATKSSDDLALGDPQDLEARADNDHHLVMVMRATRRLGERIELRKLKLTEHAGELGFKGHWSTKSRRYSTTFKELRRARRDHVRAVRCKSRVPLDAWGREENQETVERRSEWCYVGWGYRNNGEAFLAMQAAARAREYRRFAREELSMTTSGSSDGH